MKKILARFWKFFTDKKRLPYTIGVIIILILCTIIYIQHNKNTKLKQEHQTEVKYNNALNDSIDYYQNKEKEWVAERLSIQTTVKNFKEIEEKLTDNQKILLAKIERVERDNHIIVAALIETQIKIDSLREGNVEVDTEEKTIAFTDSTEAIQYEFVAGNVLPAYRDVKPTLDVKNLFFPNEQFINFNWLNDKKEGYPVSFSVTNSNKYFETININSYAIPQLDKNELDPTSWQKFTTWTKVNGKWVLVVGVTATATAGITYLLTR